MSWTNSDWTCDNQNAGYPYITAAGVADVYDPSDGATVWALHPAVLMGYPHILAVFPPAPHGAAPKITGFSLHGMGAGFRELDDAWPLDIPDEVMARFRPDRGEVRFIFHYERTTT